MFLVSNQMISCCKLLICVWVSDLLVVKPSLLYSLEALSIRVLISLLELVSLVDSKKEFLEIVLSCSSMILVWKNWSPISLVLCCSNWVWIWFKFKPIFW